MNEIIFDLEGDGLEPTKIYCLVYEDQGKINVLTDYNEMRALFSRKDCVFIGHHIIGFDIPTLERILSINLEHIEKIDTLPISWYLRPEERRHGLEVWGERLGIKKPEISDWLGLSLETYIHRCTEDVKINKKLWDLFKRELLAIYRKSEDAKAFIHYLNFKAKCLHLASKSKWKLDVKKCKSGIDILSRIAYNKCIVLEKAMPKVPVYAKRVEPKIMYKKDKTLSAAGERWTKLLQEYEREEDGSIREIIGYEVANPNSHEQVKNWLYSLGWKPCTYKANKKKEDVPQITVIGGPELTASVASLIDVEPALEELEGLFTVNHRLSILEGFLKNQVDGYLTARASGFTNTLRLKHSELVNLPGVSATYGEFIRPCLIAPEGFELCGADMSSLEDRTKQHYIYPYDPEYVEEQNKDGFDPHLDIASLGGMVTKEEIEQYKTNPTPELVAKRRGAKVTNYSCTYGAYPPKIAKTAGITIKEATNLWEAYWKRNWAIKEVVNNAEIIEAAGRRWLRNPVNGFYYSLRSDKDIFSTLNQGTGSYCFDVWLGFVLDARDQLTAQFHDEGVWMIRKGHREEMRELLTKAINDTNEYLKLNRELGIGIQFGDNYGEIH